jgi:hypothetical protein
MVRSAEPDKGDETKRFELMARNGFPGLLLYLAENAGPTTAKLRAMR